MGQESTATITPMFQPNVDAMNQHVEHLFGGYLDGCHDGMVELSWTETKPDTAGRYRLRNARMYSTDNLDGLVQEAARLNSQPMCNVYIGAALRHPDTPPFGRGEDKDAWALTCVYADLDDPEAAANPKEIYGLDKPTMVVVTGRAPHTRAQLWWRLEEPLTDKMAWPALLRGISKRLKGDSTVTNPSRVMRLAGSIAWPVKEGRTVELTGIAQLKEPGRCEYSPEHLAQVFPPISDARSGPVDTGSVSYSTNSLGLADKINDGREGVMVRSINTSLVHFIGETGCAPTAQELYDAAWPQYERKVDLTRAGRGPAEFAEKCTYTLRRFEEGRIRGIETLDKAVERYQAKAASHPAQPQRPLPAPARQDAAIKTTDFMTLLTEDVIEEPDYIEPGFAGPGTFVLIAGPPKAQKSFLLQEMLVAAATGSNFLMDKFRCPRPLRVFYLQAEMNRKLLRKRAREFKFLTVEEKRLLASNLIISERFHMILNENGVKTAVETIKAAFPDDPPDIIAVDPLANVFDQDNENDNAQLMRFLTGRIEAVRQQVNPSACVVMVHHATKKSADDMAKDPFVAIRGAGALRGYYDSAIVIFRAGEESKTRKLHFELRSGESPEPMSLELVDGRFKTSSPTSSITKEVARQILREIDAAWQRNEPWSSHPRSRVEGRYAAANASAMFSVHVKAVEALIAQWLINNVVKFQDRQRGVRPAGLKVVGGID